MDVTGWLVVFVVACVLVSLIARSRGRSGVAAFFAMAVPPVPLMMLVSYSLGNDMEAKPLAMWCAAFLCPVIGLIWALTTKSKDEMAAELGTYGDRKKCPFCAEPIRIEAIKCKHCGSDLTVPPAAPTAMPSDAERADINQILATPMGMTPPPSA